MTDGIDASGLKQSMCSLAGMLGHAIFSPPWLELQMLDTTASNARLVIRLPGVPAVGVLKNSDAKRHGCTTNRSVEYDYEAMYSLISGTIFFSNHHCMDFRHFLLYRGSYC